MHLHNSAIFEKQFVKWLNNQYLLGNFQLYNNLIIIILVIKKD